MLRASNVVPIEEWASESPIRTSFNPFLGKGKAKASLNRANFSSIEGPETGWANHEQGELRLQAEGGPNSSELQICEMTCG